MAILRTAVLLRSVSTRLPRSSAKSRRVARRLRADQIKRDTANRRKGNTRRRVNTAHLPSKVNMVMAQTTKAHTLRRTSTALLRRASMDSSSSSRRHRRDTTASSLHQDSTATRNLHTGRPRQGSTHHKDSTGHHHRGSMVVPLQGSTERLPHPRVHIRPIRRAAIHLRASSLTVRPQLRMGPHRTNTVAPQSSQHRRRQATFRTRWYKSTFPGPLTPFGTP